jgi:quercetin 2,3-dioxygenase
MSAGAGVTHSEMNNHPKDTCRFLQIWVTPQERGLPVRYGSHVFTEADRANKLLHMIKGTGESAGADAPIQLKQVCLLCIKLHIFQC